MRDQASGGRRASKIALPFFFFPLDSPASFATPERESLTGVANFASSRMGARCLPETSAPSTGCLNTRALLFADKAEEETRQRGGADPRVIESFIF